jgi:hypothetical protein
MSFQLSPGENVTELDLTTIVPSVATTAGAFAAYTPWGPVQKIITVTDEISLVNNFAPKGPDANSATGFLTATSFLAYGNNLQFVRAVGDNAKQAQKDREAAIFYMISEKFFDAPKGS